MSERTITPELRFQSRPAPQAEGESGFIFGRKERQTQKSIIETFHNIEKGDWIDITFVWRWEGREYVVPLSNVYVLCTLDKEMEVSIAVRNFALQRKNLPRKTRKFFDKQINAGRDAGFDMHLLSIQVNGMAHKITHLRNRSAEERARRKNLAP